MYKRENYARTLEKIAKNGPGELYGGQTGRDLLEDLSARGGKMTMKDLTDYRYG